MQHQKRYNQTENGSGPFRVAWGRAQKALGATQVKHEIMFDHRSASFCPCSQPLLRCSGLSALATGPKRSKRNLTKKDAASKALQSKENGSGPFHLCVCAGNGWRKRSFEQHRGQGKTSVGFQEIDRLASKSELAAKTALRLCTESCMVTASAPTSCK